MAAQSRFVAEGEAHSITLVAASPVPTAARKATTLWAGAFAALSLVLLVALPRRRVQDWLAANAALLIAVAGVVWWLVAPWPVAGWVLVAAAVWLSLRWTWPRGGYEPSAASW
jgi:hypothetical protein